MTRSTTRYAALALIDTRANYLIVKAFRTSRRASPCWTARNPFDGAVSRGAAGVYSRRHVWAEPPP